MPHVTLVSWMLSLPDGGASLAGYESFPKMRQLSAELLIGRRGSPEQQAEYGRDGHPILSQ
jgi:hypothetical protein